MSIKKAVIVAAGKSSRLYPRTLDKPKGLLDIDGIQIIKHSLQKIESLGITEIAIVTGYKSEYFEAELGKNYQYIFNPFYEQCNNMGSLWFAKDFIQSDSFIYLHSDIMYDEEILTFAFQQHNQSNHPISLVVDFKETDEEAMKVRVTDNNLLLESNKEIAINDAAGEWTGIALINNSAEVLNQMQKDLKEDGLNFYDTYSFTKMVKNGTVIKCIPTNNKDWVEIDFEEDFQNAIRLFSKELN